MNKRTLVIDSCQDCPHFSNYYYSYEEKCIELDRVIKIKREESTPSKYIYPIPEDCPLEKANE